MLSFIGGSLEKVLGKKCRWPGCNNAGFSIGEHEKVCEKRLVSCKWAHCKARLTVNRITKHEKSCDLRKVPCKWPNCNQQINHYYVQYHEDICQKRISNCEECDDGNRLNVKEGLGDNETLRIETVANVDDDDVAHKKQRKCNQNAATKKTDNVKKHDIKSDTYSQVSVAISSEEYPRKAKTDSIDVVKYKKTFLKPNDNAYIQHIIQIALGQEYLEVEEPDDSVPEEQSPTEKNKPMFRSLIAKDFEAKHEKIIQDSEMFLKKSSKKLRSILEHQDENRIYDFCHLCSNESLSCCDFDRIVTCWIPKCHYQDKYSSFRTHLLENHDECFVQKDEITKTIKLSQREIVWYMGVEDKIFYCWCKWLGGDASFDAKFLGANFLGEQWKVKVKVLDVDVSKSKTVSTYGGCLTIRFDEIFKTNQIRRNQCENKEIEFNFNILKHIL